MSTPAAARNQVQPGLALTMIGGAGAGDGLELPGPDRGGELGLQRGVGAAGAAAEPVVVELDDRHVAAEERADSELGVLDVTEMAGVVDGDRRGDGRRARRAGAGRCRSASHWWTSTTRR